MRSKNFERDCWLLPSFTLTFAVEFDRFRAGGGQTIRPDHMAAITEVSLQPAGLTWLHLEAPRARHLVFTGAKGRET
jgi:hypothetical protein